MKCAIALLILGCAMHIQAGTYTKRFLQQYGKIKNTSNGYFSGDGIPYHSVETLVVEAPDYGHQTTSEEYSYYIYLEAMYGAINGSFENFKTAWQSLEDQIIPKLQPTNSFYNPGKPASYAAVFDETSQYPRQIDSVVSVGADPISQELDTAYNSKDVYAMHWLLDVDNVYGFGNTQSQCLMGPTAKGASFINTFQRGPSESVWKTIPQPTCDNFKYGGPNGFLDLFIKDSNYVPQWKYSNAPDADARAVQASFWAAEWAKDHDKQSNIKETLDKAAKLGDYLRYALFDKYFKKIGNCVGPYGCPAAQCKNSAHYLLSSYFAWGGSLSPNGGWAWRIGDGAAHFGYQNPLAAYALSQSEYIKPKGATAREDWKTSLDRQIEFYEWLQTKEGAFAGGATNSWKGRYGTPPSNLTLNTFHGMFYDWEPVYNDPPSNTWFGWQARSTDRLAQYYYVTGDAKVKKILDKWASWVTSVIKFNGDDYQVPEHLSWSGAPPDVHVEVTSYSQDVGVASGVARSLAYYAARSQSKEAKTVARKLLDGIWKHQTELGVSREESLDSYNQFNDKVYVPPGWTGQYPNGDVIDSSATFLSIRSWYKKDKDFPMIKKYMSSGEVPKMTLHRFWAQADVALAQGAYGLLFNE